MAIPILIMGKSGSGKSASMRNLSPATTGVINVLGKPFPFRQSGADKLRSTRETDYSKIITIISRTPSQTIVIDDANYLITTQFMSNFGARGKGNDVFGLYSDMGINFWKLIEIIREDPSDKRVYVVMHEDKSDMGDIKPKTIGKMLDDKVCVEGLFTVVLRSALRDGRYVFLTQTDGYDVCKTPIGMFNEREIDNDLAMVDRTICEYYGIHTMDTPTPAPGTSQYQIYKTAKEDHAA